MARRMLFIVSKTGSAETGGLTPALAQATVAAAMDVSVQLVVTGPSAGLLDPDTAASIRLMDGSGRSVQDGLQQARELGVKLLLCSPALAEFGRELEGCVDEVVGAAWLVSESLREDTVVLTY